MRIDSKYSTHTQVSADYCFLLLFSVHEPKQDHAHFAQVCACVFCKCLDVQLEENNVSVHMKLRKEPLCKHHPGSLAAIAVKARQLWVIGPWCYSSSSTDSSSLSPSELEFRRLLTSCHAQTLGGGITPGMKMLEKRSHCLRWKGWLTAKPHFLLLAPVSKGLCSFEDRNRPSSPLGRC